MMRPRKAIIPAAALLFTAAVLLASPCLGAGDGAEKAMDHLRRNRFRTAIDLARGLEGAAGTNADLVVGTACLRTAQLYLRLHDLSVTVHLDHLKRVAAAKGKERSRLAPLFLGETRLEAGDPGGASKELSALQTAEGLGDGVKALSRVLLGKARAGSGDRQRADGDWKGLDGSAIPEVLSVLAWARLETGGREKAMALVEKASPKPGASALSRPWRSLAAGVVLAEAGQAKRALDLAQGTDWQEPFLQEDAGENKSLRFYSPSLLRGLGLVYGNCAVDALRRAALSPREGDTARLLLAQAYQLTGRFKESEAALAVIESSPSAGNFQANFARVRQAVNEHRMGSTSGRAALAQLARQAGKEPLLLGEVLLACSDSGLECAEAAAQASALAEGLAGRQKSRLMQTLGRYHLSRKETVRAMALLEDARDKGNKNRIEFNDPLLLADLAEGNYRTKRFSEALEILFGMAAEFPAVRGLQEAIQGVYSTEQKSAGDVKVL